jgi:hypothetical protein
MPPVGSDIIPTVESTPTPLVGSDITPTVGSAPTPTH